MRLRLNRIARPANFARSNQPEQSSEAHSERQNGVLTVRPNRAVSSCGWPRLHGDAGNLESRQTPKRIALADDQLRLRYKRILGIKRLYTVDTPVPRIHCPNVFETCRPLFFCFADYLSQFLMRRSRSDGLCRDQLPNHGRNLLLLFFRSLYQCLFHVPDSLSEVFVFGECSSNSTVSCP